MATNIVYEPGYKLSVVVTDPATPTSGAPIRYGQLTGIALTDEGAGGNAATETSVDFGPFVANLSVADGVGGGIAVGAVLFYSDALDGLTNDPSGNYFFGFAMETVGAGLTATIKVLHSPSPGAGTLGAGTVATANLAAGIISADAAGRALFAAGVLDAATALSAFGVDSIANAFLLDAIANGAFQADAATRALFADEVWTEAKIAAASLTGLVCKVVADANVIGGIPVIHRIAMAGGATATIPVVLTHKTRILDAQVILKGLGTAGDTITVKNGANAITDAIDINDADKTISRAATIDDAQYEVAAGATLNITETDGGGNDSPACEVVIYGIRVA